MLFSRPAYIVALICTVTHASGCGTENGAPFKPGAISGSNDDNDRSVPVFFEDKDMFKNACFATVKKDRSGRTDTALDIETELKKGQKLLLKRIDKSSSYYAYYTNSSFAGVSSFSISAEYLDEIKCDPSIYKQRLGVLADTKLYKDETYKTVICELSAKKEVSDVRIVSTYASLIMTVRNLI